MEPPRSGVKGAVSVIGAIILLIGSIHRAASELPSETCKAGTDGTSADAPCMHKAYLGSTVKIDCTGGYDTAAPGKVFTQSGLNACEKKMAAPPAACDSEVTLASKGLLSVKVASNVFYIPWVRNVEFKGPVTLYGRCSKDNNNALYFGIEYIPRPKFPQNGVFVSCPSLVTTANSTCMLDSLLGDFAVFDCPAGNPPVIVPTQASGRATMCDANISTAHDQTCSGAGGTSVDVSQQGVTAVELKNGADQLRTLGWKNPQTGTKVTVEGYVNCQGASNVTAFYKYKLEFKKSPYTMPAEYKVCDPADGSDQSKPCSISLKPGDSYVVNCSSLTKTAPDNLMKSDGSYCTKMPGTDANDLCADNKKSWKDSGVEAFPNAGNLVITHKKDSLSSPVTAYGKCFEGADGNYFKIVLETTSSTDTPSSRAFTINQSNGLGIFFGVLGFICLSTEAFLKI